MAGKGSLKIRWLPISSSASIAPSFAPRARRSLTYIRLYCINKTLNGSLCALTSRSLPLPLPWLSSETSDTVIVVPTTTMAFKFRNTLMTPFRWTSAQHSLGPAGLFTMSEELRASLLID
jgi:hypothetical protein